MTPQAPAKAGFFDLPAELDDRPLAERFSELQRRYRGLIDMLPAVIYLDSVVDHAPMIDVGPRIEDLFGLSRHEWLVDARSWEAAIHPDDRTRVLAESDASVATGTPFRTEYRVLHRDGRTVWIREEAVLVHDEDGHPVHWLGLMLDISQRVQVQHELEVAHSQYGALVEQIPAIVYIDIVDEQMSTSYVSPQIERLLGVTQQEYIDNPALWESMLHPDDRDAAMATYLRGRGSGQPFVYEYRLIARDGREVWFRDSAIVLPGDEGRPGLIQGVMLDITESKAAEAQLAYLAYHDKLTGLPNRAMFDELLGLALARARRNDLGVAVVSVDLDNFKLINDSLGHEAGDALIGQLAERLRFATRETDLVARPGGDEFLLMLADLDLTPPMPGGRDGAVAMAESVAVRVHEALREPFEIANTELYLTASMGLSVFPVDAADGLDLMRNADTAMFASKKAGPGGYVIHTVEAEDAMVRLSLSTRLRRAVEQRQWTLHYQPILELNDARMVGVEALIRWPDPTGGLVPPGEFIPLAEEMGLIEAIGDWVIEEICRQDTQWRAEGLILDIGFNLSPRQLWQNELVDKIISPLIVAGMDPRRITVEITESTAMGDPDRTVAILSDLHERGLRLAIDDFGTGYSSLARLRHMPVDILKIDRSFVRDVDADGNAGSMVSAMISLANNLGMTPLAEGIETEREWRFLSARGCELGQGFFFSRPVPADEILTMHRRSQLAVVDGEAAS